MSWTREQLDVCQEAFFILRQDIGLPTPEEADTDNSLEWTKCKIAYETARQEVLSRHDWVFARTEENKTDISKWPGDVRNALAYCLARELAIPIAGRLADLQAIKALYDEKLQSSILHDLEEEDAEVSDPLHREVLAFLRSTYNSDVPPRSVRALTGKIDSLKDMSRKEVIGAYDWSFAQTDGYCDPSPNALPDPLYPFHATLPFDCIKLSTVYGHDGRVGQWKLRGRVVHALNQIGRIVYLRDIADFKEWDPKVYRVFILRLAADVAKAVATNPKNQQYQEALYRDALEDAKASDAGSANTPDEAWGDLGDPLERD